MSKRLMAIVAGNMVAALALLYTIGLIPPTSGRTAGPLLLIAHRGDAARHPENTIEAFRAAAEQGADGIEMDVWRSQSGTWWIMHDPTLDRTTNGSGAIANETDGEIAALRIDIGPVGTAGGPPIPRLTDALDALADYHGLIYIHLKETAQDAATDLGSLLASIARVTALTVIVPSEASAASVQAADSGLRTIVLKDGLGTPRATQFVDGWLTTEGRIIRADIVAWRPYPVEVYANGASHMDETDSIGRAYRYNVQAYITNDLLAAQKIRAALEAGA